MSAKRIRCDCGRVYDPGKHPKCPDCGTPTPQLVAPPPPDPVEDSVAAKSAPPPTGPTPAPRPAINPRLLVGGAVALLALLGTILIVRPKPDHKVAKVEPSPTPTSSATAIPTPAPTAAPTAPVFVTPPRTETPPPTAPAFTLAPPMAFDLAGAIAGAAPGATIRIPAGFYRGGFVVRQPLHLVGQAQAGGMVLIQSEGKEALSVEAKDVSVSNVQFNAQGIGQLPAIAVSKGAELKLDGCNVQSGSEVAVTVAGDGLLTTVGTTFSAARGLAVRMDAGAKGNFTQSFFSNSIVGLSLTGGAVAELHGCAFENDGMNDSDGATVSLAGEKTQMTGDDCHFTNNSGALDVTNRAALTLQNSAFKSNGGSSRGVIGLVVLSRGGNARLTNTSFESNRAGVLVTAGGRLEMEKCNFDQNGFAQPRGVAAGSLPLSVAGRGSSAVVRHCVLSRSAPYAASVVAGGQLTVEDTEISGSSEIGLLVGEPSASGGGVEIRRSHFLGNSVGLGVCATGSAVVEATEFRQNKDGIVVLGSDSELRLTKSKLLANRSQGLHVFGNASATAVDCELRDNQIGALSGTRGRSEPGSITLENCRFAGNHLFGAGAARQSELVLNECVFDGTDKTNIYRERGANVQTNDAPTPTPVASPPPDTEASPSPEESAAPSASPSPGSSPTPSPTPAKSTPRSHHRPPKHPHPPTPEEIERTLRKLLPGGN